MNPARTLGSNAVAGKWDHLWLYWLAPCLGGAVAGIFYQAMSAVPASTEDNSYAVKNVEGVLQKDLKTDLES